MSTFSAKNGKSGSADASLDTASKISGPGGASRPLAGGAAGAGRPPGETRGYRNHPQLIRFRNHPEPPAAIGVYLTEILGEALRRGYRFNPAKIGPCRDVPAIPVTRGQLLYERDHLLGKLTVRDCAACRVSDEDR